MRRFQHFLRKTERTKKFNKFNSHLNCHILHWKFRHQILFKRMKKIILIQQMSFHPMRSQFIRSKMNLKTRTLKMNSPNSATRPRCLAGSWRKRSSRKSCLELSQKLRMKSILSSIACILSRILIKQIISKMSTKLKKINKILIETLLLDNLKK